tara:strand:- start:707 stop:916 length:210 start_codon:yes stop_codon:yes gene_type:complete
VDWPKLPPFAKRETKNVVKTPLRKKQFLKNIFPALQKTKGPSQSLPYPNTVWIFIITIQSYGTKVVDPG